MIRHNLFRNIFGIPRYISIKNNYSTSVDIEKLEQEEVEIEIDADEVRRREEEIERKRNKSRLYSQHRNLVNGVLPNPEPQIWQHETLKYKRKMYGLYGDSSGVNPSLCWPTEKELADKMHLEKVTDPFTIAEMVAKAEEKRKAQYEFIKKRQDEIAAKLTKLDQWTEDMHKRVAKKEADIKAAKDRKDRLVEEVRRHFGYKVDPKDEKFKEMLEKKEKAEKKLMKEARRKLKEDKLIAKLKGNKSDTSDAKTVDKTEENKND